MPSQSPLHKIIPSILSPNGASVAQLVPLLDPDKVDMATLPALINEFKKHQINLLFVGGSHVTSSHIEAIIEQIRAIAPEMKMILFPGSPTQITAQANGILFLSLVSGRNPDLLISRHIEAAPILQHLLQLNTTNPNQSYLNEIIPTAYMLIDGGRVTTAQYISGTLPIPADKIDVAESTALASAFLGHKAVYLDTGSGADRTVPPTMIKAIKVQFSTLSQEPIVIVGGGIRTEDNLRAVFEAGANIAVIGSLFEQDPSKVSAMASVRDSFR